MNYVKQRNSDAGSAYILQCNWCNFSSDSVIEMERHPALLNHVSLLCFLPKNKYKGREGEENKNKEGEGDTVSRVSRERKK